MVPVVLLPWCRVGHGNLMRAASDTYASEGGSAAYGISPAAEHGFDVVARLSPEGWLELADRFAARE